MSAKNNIRWRGQISIQQVLAEIRGDENRPFWLAFVRATGNDAGSIKIVSSAQYGAPKLAYGRKVKPLSSQPRSGVGTAKALHSEKGTLPITDTTTNQYLSPLISHIVGYNLYQVIH
jgi:hypothetical protein